MATNEARKVGLAAFAVSVSLLVASVPGAAEPLVVVEGVGEVGTVDPWTVQQAGGTGSSGGSSSSGSSSSSRCIINTWFGCLFTLREQSANEHVHTAQQSYFWYNSQNVQQSGYYTELLGGAIFVRAESGTVESASGSGGGANAVNRDWTYYANNLGYSEEHLQQNLYSASGAASSTSEVSRLGAAAGANTPAGGANVDLVREQDGFAQSANRFSSAGSNLTRHEYFGLPLYEAGNQQARAFANEAMQHWNRTLANGEVYLVNPQDGNRVEIIGLVLDKGDAQGSGSGSSSQSSQSHTSIFGFRLIEQGNSAASQYEYAFFNQWLHLIVDVGSGTVTGSILYDRGTSSSSNTQHTNEYTNIFGIPIWGQEHYTENEATSAWRNVEFNLNAVQGTGVFSVGAWDQDSSSYQAYEDTYRILGIPVGLEGEDQSTLHTDGVAMALNLGGGVLWLNAGYENRTATHSSVDDFTLGGSPLFGLYENSYEASRRIAVGAGSNAIGTHAGLYYENVTEQSARGLRLGGNNFLGLEHADQHTGYGADAGAVNGLFVFQLGYTDGQSMDAINIAGFPIGLRDDYQEFETGASGGVPNPQGGSLLVYSFEHSETAHDYTLFLGDTDLGTVRRNVSSDRLNVMVLNNLAGAEVSREFSNTAVFVGETELVDATAMSADGDAHAGPASTGTSIWFGYLELVDAIAVGLLIATWCVDPGVALPTGTVLNLVPATYRGTAAAVVAVAMLAICGLPVVAPVPFFLLSPCILVPVAHGLVFATAGGLSGSLGAAAGLAGYALDAAGSTSWTAYDTVNDARGGCIWLTIPDEVRNPQPVLWVLGPATAASNGVLAERIWPAYDGGRQNAYGAIDRIFNADALVENPGGIMSPDQVRARLAGTIAGLPVAPPAPLPAIPDPGPVVVTPPVGAPAVPQPGPVGSPCQAGQGSGATTFGAASGQTGSVPALGRGLYTYGVTTSQTYYGVAMQRAGC